MGYMAFTEGAITTIDMDNSKPTKMSPGLAQSLALWVMGLLQAAVTPAFLIVMQYPNNRCLSQLTILVK
jgi:hypothetical protein